MNQTNRYRRAFTLMELLVTVSVIGVLVTIGINSSSSHKLKVRDARRVSELNSIKDAVQLYFEENGTFPNSLNDIKGSFDGILPKDPKTGLDYMYVKINATPPTPKGYCLLAVLETLQSSGSCTTSISGSSEPKRYIIQGPL